MSEFRRNPFTGEWTLYAENRKNKPYEFAWSKPEKKSENRCPFCIGHESWTTPAVYQDGADEQWNIRVFPNMYPAVCMGDLGSPKEIFYEQAIGAGRHEVLVDTPIHGETIDMFPKERLLCILQVLRMRYESIRAETDTLYVQIFKNCGAEAGMSIQHSHWQLVGLPIVPERIRKMMSLGIQKDNCRFCKMLAYETEVQQRIAAENDAFLAIAPYASRYPYEVWILPKQHRSTFGELTEEELSALAEMLGWILPKVARLRQDVGYNICMMDGPKNGDFHWHLQILPRIGGFAGFENATDCFINTVRPETAAAYYRRKVAAEKKS